MNGNSWRMALRVAIYFCMTRAKNKDEFKCEMKKLGYDMVWTPERKYITYICPTQNGKERRVRDIKLNDEKYLKENIRMEIARYLLPDIIAYYESEQGQKEFAEWKAQQEALKREKSEVA